MRKVDIGFFLNAVTKNGMGNQIRGTPFLLWLLLTAGTLGASDEWLVSKGKAGPIERGMEISALQAKVGRDRTKRVDKHAGGVFAPVLEIYLKGDLQSRPSIVVEIVGQHPAQVVGRITVYDRRYKTEKGIGVGSTLGEVRQRYKVDWIDFGEGPLCARVNEMGMTFVLDVHKIPRAWHKTRNQALIPDSAKVI